MPLRLADDLRGRAVAELVGRDRELSILLEALTPGGPAVVHLHGISGIGKTSLLHVFSAAARDRGASAVHLDCRAIEPTERGFLDALSDAVGGHGVSLMEVVERLSRVGGPPVLVLDNYESFRLLDTWLRQVFVPALTDEARVVLAGRDPASAGWRTAPGWGGLFQSLALGSLDEAASVQLLRRLDVEEALVDRILDLSRGHPLALKLAASLTAEMRPAVPEQIPEDRVVDELARLFLDGVADEATRQAAMAVSVVRRVTRSVLQALLPDAAPADLLGRLHALPFTEAGHDGLVMHDAVRQAFQKTLRASDPEAYRGYRRRAWRALRAEASDAPIGELWRYTADMLFILDNPVLREAFFPSGGQSLSVEPFRTEHTQAVRDIVERHEGPEAAAVLMACVSELPSTFRVVKGEGGTISGFHCLVEAAEAWSVARGTDPVVDRCLVDLEAHPMEPGERALLCRRWLSRDHGEVPSPEQAASWLDIKRTYMELRPRLRRVYMSLKEVDTYAPAAAKLGFRPLDELRLDEDDDAYGLFVLDMGPRSVDGWLSRLVADELGISEEGELLDCDARALVLDGDRVGLTPLEFGVMRYLSDHVGNAVSRRSLLHHVWKQSYTEGSSNVVDAIVRSLRRKLRARAREIETVSGVGYRLSTGRSRTLRE